ncbi:hypothetical protein [Flavobacterium sp. WV_118_3]|jgi:hypothetical protein|uniref:hypothetical protein n=1 Tax=Flavobacterium sp. WV_118_3 TaxID=3151764 RepID=UPI002C4A6E01|nr:hypothetical protein [Flavobacterium sp.]
MITNTTEFFIEIIAEEGRELFNGEQVANRVTAPVGTDLSDWIEREPVQAIITES